MVANELLLMCYSYSKCVDESGDREWQSVDFKCSIMAL